MNTPPDTATLHRWMWIIWPAFLVAGLMEVLVFAFVDPHDLRGWGADWGWSKEAIYTVSFFAFWGLAMLSSGLTSLLSMPPSELACEPEAKGQATDNGGQV
jgi:hypothetical protein